MATTYEPERAVAAFRFDNSFARELEGFFVPQQPAVVRAARLLFFNDSLVAELGLDLNSVDADERAAIFAGNRLPDGATPVAQAYAGHQFGGFVPQLGDGRALLLGEVVGTDGLRRDLQLKGSGRTPFSRGGEAMAALGVPTARALAAVTTGERIVRQDGLLPGAVFTRVAASHIRVGTFEY